MGLIVNIKINFCLLANLSLENLQKKKLEILLSSFGNHIFNAT